MYADFVVQFLLSDCIIWLRWHMSNATCRNRLMRMPLRLQH